jgi:uroporphyrinogen-III synthase
MPLNNIRILSTRPLPETIIINAAEKGFVIDTESFIRTEAVNIKEVVDEIQLLATKKITAIFTSMNGVETVIAQLSSKPDWKIFCMGGATKELVGKFFGTKLIMATARDAESLAKKIIANKNIEEPVFFCGDQRLDKLPEMLTTAGIELKELVVYKTVHTPKLVEKNYDAIVFFSPSAVHSFFDVNTVATDVILFAIGKTTAAAVHTYVNNELVTSKWPGKEQMIEQVLQYFENSEKSSVKSQ